MEFVFFSVSAADLSLFSGVLFEEELVILFAADEDESDADAPLLHPSSEKQSRQQRADRAKIRLIFTPRSLWGTERLLLKARLSIHDRQPILLSLLY